MCRDGADESDYTATVDDEHVALDAIFCALVDSEIVA